MVKPVPAASIVLHRDGEDGDPEFLMGQRSAAHRFMPYVYVFPGGRVDEADHLANEGWAWSPLPGTDLSGTGCPVEIFLTAAYRELEEETGYRVDVLEPGSPVYLIARAITPEPSPVRFDTLFFLARARLQGQAGAPVPVADSDELENCGWYGAREIEGLATANITLRILDQAIRTIEDAGANSFYACG